MIKTRIGILQPHFGFTQPTQQVRYRHKRDRIDIGMYVGFPASVVQPPAGLYCGEFHLGSSAFSLSLPSLSSKIDQLVHCRAMKWASAGDAISPQVGKLSVSNTNSHTAYSAVREASDDSGACNTPL